MSDFLNDAFEPFEISTSDLEAIIFKIIKLWPEKVLCGQKEFGPSSFTSKTIVQQGKVVRDDFEDVDWGEYIDIAGIAMDFVGLAIKNSSKYLSIVRTKEIDMEMIAADILARDDVVVIKR